MGLPGRRFLTPRVSFSCAPVLSFAHFFQAPATQTMKGVTSGKKNVEDNENFKLLWDFSIQISSCIINTVYPSDRRVDICRQHQTGGKDQQVS